MAQKKKQLVAEGKLDKHGRPNENTPKEYLRSLPDVTASKVSCSHCLSVACLVMAACALSLAPMRQKGDVDGMHIIINNN